MNASSLYSLEAFIVRPVSYRVNVIGLATAAREGAEISNDAFALMDDGDHVLVQVTP
jgi:hypothetical protein